MKPKSFLYRNEKKEWEWRTVLGKSFTSKRIIGASTEGYKRRETCIRNYDLLVGLKRIPLWDESGAQKQITKATGLGY